jgi:hypothetical protein
MIVTIIFADERTKVDCADAACKGRKCFWPRPDPGSFLVGRGYRSNGNKGWLCGTRQAHGCPDEVSIPFTERMAA